MAYVNWNLYKYFIAVYETKSFSKAADILGVSPSAVSQSIKELGNQLDKVLFTSSRQGANPTPDGEEVYKQIKPAYEAITNVEDSALDANAEGTIRIAVHSWFARTFLSNYMKEFRTNYPKVKIIVTQNNNVGTLKQKQADLAIDFDRLLKDTSVRTIDIFNKDVKTVMVATKSFLRERGLTTKLTTADVLKMPIIEQVEWFGEYKNWLGKDLKPFEMATQAQAHDYFISMVKNDMGISGFGKCMIKELVAGDPEIVELDITPPPPSFRFVCAYNPPLTRHAKAFVDGLLKFCRTPENTNKVF